MGLFNRFFGRKDKTSLTERVDNSNSGTDPISTTSRRKVSDSRIWKCPKCGMVLEKSSYGSVFRQGEALPDNYQGASTCSNCGSVYDWRDVYSGKYDPTEKAITAGRIANPPKRISLVAYLLGSMTPPSEVREYAEHILKAKYPDSQLHKQYLIGRRDNYMTETEALVQYNDYLRTGDLPNLGKQFDSHTGTGLDGTKVVVLFFKP